MWSPGGQLPYEYIKRILPPPPLSCLISFQTRAVQGSERLLDLAFLWIEARLLRRGVKRYAVPHPYPLPSLWCSSHQEFSWADSQPYGIPISVEFL